MMDKRNIPSFNDLLAGANSVMKELTDMHERISRIISDGEAMLKFYKMRLESINRQMEAIKELNSLSGGDALYEGMEDERD